MGNAFLHGNGGAGGGGLNFNVVGGLTQPANLKENSIWVITDVPITTWIFSPTQPEPPADGKDGAVWFLTGTSSEVAFNVLKKNVIEVYPLSAKQYIDGEWADKTAKTWNGSKWVEWTVYLYNKGDKCTSVTGGYGEKVYSGGALTWNTDSVYLGYSGSTARTTTIYTNNKIDISNFSKLNVKVRDATINTAFVFGVIDTPHIDASGGYSEFISNCVAAHSETDNIDSETVLSLDISSLSGNYYIQLYAGYVKVTVTEVYLS